jgi:hypothetical protein
MNVALAAASGNTRSSEFIEVDSGAWQMLPPDHVAILHPVQRGFAAVAQVGSKWVEKPIPIRDLERYTAHLGNTNDVFISQQGFKGWRSIVNLIRLGACYVDLDYHHTRWAGERPEVVRDAVLRQLDDADMPEPSYILSTGRGLLVVWLLDPTTRNALPRWMPCQKALAKSLHGFGADPRALDAARVFRLVGTVNSKSGGMVRQVYMSGLSAADVTRYDFSTFADEVLPLRQAELHSLRIERAKRRDQKAKVLAVPNRNLNAGTLWEGRLDELQALREDLRWGFGLIKPGQRDTWLFLALLAMAWLIPPGEAGLKVLDREVKDLCKLYGDWDEPEARSRMAAILSRAKRAARGETVEWNGKSYSPLYRFKTETIIEWLDITEDEMRRGGFRYLVTDAIKREQDRERKRAERGSDLKQQTKAQQREQARIMAAAGAKQAEIAALFGVSQVTVGRWLKS